MRSLPLLFALAVLFGAARPAFAFPELVRKGYGNCISCHVSTSGGGVLTAYGRELSLEALSWMGTEKESLFAYGLVQTPEWAALGGDVRTVQTYRNTDLFVSESWIWMQADLEAAVSFGKLTADGTVGLDYFGNFVSRRHYLILNLTDEIHLRGGRFLLPYGINSADHLIATKRLGLLDLDDEDEDSYNIEASYIGEAVNVYLTGTFGRPSLTIMGEQLDHGGALSASYYFAEKYKVGVSAYHGSNDFRDRYIAGPWLILGFTPQVFLLSEWDFQDKAFTGGDHFWGTANYNKLDYEFIKGFHVYLEQDYYRDSFADPNSNSFQNYGAGLQIFPRPHFEINMSWNKTRTSAIENDFENYAWLMLHFYP